MPVPPRSTALSHTVPALQAVASDGELLSSTLSSLPSCTSFPLKQGDVVKTTKEARSYRGTNVPGDRTTDSAQTTKFSHPKPRCPPLLLPRMQQAGIPPVSLPEATPADCGTRGLSSPNEDGVQVCMQEKIVPSVCEVTSSTFNPNSVLRLESNQEKVETPCSSSAPKGASTGTSSAAELHGTLPARSVETQKSNASSHKLKSPVRATSANMAVAGSLSWSEAQKASRFVGSDALSCSSSCSLSDTPAFNDQADISAVSTTGAAVPKPHAAGDRKAASRCSTSVTSEYCHSTVPTPALGGSTLSTLSPRNGEASEAAIQTAYFSINLLLTGSNESCLAADAQKKMRVTTAASSNDATTVRGAAGANKEANPLSGSVSLVNDSFSIPKQSSANDKRQTAEAPPVSAQPPSAVGEAPRQRDTATSAAQISPASSANKPKSNSVSGRLDYADSAAVLTSPSVAHKPSCVFHPSAPCVRSPLPPLHSQFVGPPAAPMDFSGDDGSSASCRVDGCVLEEPFLNLGKLTDYSGRAIERSEGPHCVQREENIDACPEALPVDTAPAGGRTGSRPGRRVAAENEALASSGISRSHSTPQSLLESFIFADGRQDKPEHPLLPMPPATAETPSTVTSSNSASSASASCSPASSSPSVKVVPFHKSEFASTSNPPSIAQQCRCEIQNSDSLSFCKDPFRPSVNSATSTTIASSAQLSGLCPISSSPAFAFPPSSAQQAPAAFTRRVAGMSINKEDSQATNKVMEECTDEEVISESEKPALSSKPQQTPGESASEELHHSITASQKTWFATSDRKRKRAVGLHATIPRAEVGRNEAILTVSCLQGTEHSLVEPVLATEEPAQLNVPHTRPSTMNASSLCFRLHSPFQPAAHSAPGVPPEPALPRSLATNASSERGGPSCNTVLKVGLPAAPTGARGDGVVRSVASIVVDGMLTASPIEAGDDGQTLPPTPVEAGEAGRGVGESSHISRGQSSAAGLYCMPQSFLTQGTTSEARGSPYHRGGAWNASTLKVRCLLAASLRSIFKMLIKRVRRQQHQRLLDSTQNAGVREMGKEVADDELLGSKRQRLDENQGKPNAVPGFDAYASSGGRASFRDLNGKQTGRLHVATTSARTFLESDSCAAALASSELKKQSTSTSFEAGPRYYCACGSHRERETVPKQINKAESSRCRAWKMEGGRCGSLDTARTRHCSSNKLHKDVPISRTTGRACDCSTSIPFGCCQPVSTSDETGMPAREMFCRNQCPCGVKGSRCLRNSKQTSSQETASLAEQQLLAAYRECFLLLSAAERKEELHIFEFVLLGGSCQYEATSLPSDENSACTINDHKGGVGERSRRSSHHVLEHVGSQRCEEGLPRKRYGDTVTASPSEAALLQGELSRNVSSAETAHMPKTKPTTINEGAQCAQVQGDVGRTCGGGNARLQHIPAGSSDADVRASKMRKRIALHPEKWDAKKIHYVLAALDGLRDAWRQGSSTTRAKAQIIESMFTPLPQGLQPRILQLAQRTQTGGPLHHAQHQRLMRFSPLQKFFEFHQGLNPNASSAATRTVSKSVMGPFTPLSSSENTGSLDLSGSADRGLPSPPQPTRAHTSVERKRCSRVCASDGKAYSRGTASDTECSETRASACCCGNQGCYPNPVHSDRIFSNRSCAPASTLCPNYGPEDAACERHQEGALSSGAAHENWKGICARPATHRLWESHATHVPPSGSRLRLPANTDALLLEKECVASRTGGRRQPSAHEQREYYQLRQPDAFTNHSSVTAVSSTTMAQIATTSLLHCTRSETLQQDPTGRDDTTCDGCNGGAESLAASSLGRSGGECTASGEKVKGIRRGKLRSTTNRSSAVDDSRDIYKKPRPSVVSRRVLLQRKLQQQHGQSTSHVTETSESDFESMSDIASSTQHGKTSVVRPTRRPLDTNSARFADTINGNRSPSGREEGQLPELNEHKLAVEAAAEKQHAAIILGDGHALGRPQSRRKSNSDSPASSSASFQQIQLFSQTLPSDICSSPQESLRADQHKASTHALTETPESPTGAAPSVTKGEPLVDARRTSRRVSLVAEEMRRVRDICLNAGITLSTSVATKDESRLVVSSIPRATSNTRDLPSLLESLQGQSLGLDAQDQTNLSDGVTCRSLRRSEEELYGKAAEGVLRSAGVAGSTLTMNSQQQTAAMRTTRHNKTKQPGVFQFTRGPKRFWAASWYADGHPGWKAFSVEKWGNREAFERARRAYEEKVPRKSREGGNANGLPELVVSSVRGPYSPVSPDPDTFPADKAIRCGASGAVKSTTCGIVHAGKRRASGTSEARNSNNAVSNAGGLTPVNTLTLSSDSHPVENYPGHQPAVDVVRMRQEPRDLGDFLHLVGGSTRQMATKQDGRDSILVQREAQRAPLQMGGNGEMSVVVSEATASCGATIVSADSKEAQQLHISSIRASSSESAASSQPETDWRQTAQQSKQFVASSTQPCPSKHTGLFEAGSTVSSSYERKSGQQRCSADADSLDLTQQGKLRELWNSCISEAGTLSLGAAFTCKEFSPAAYDSSSSSTGFELKAPAFSGSPRSSHLLRSPSRRAQGRGCRGIEQLMLSSVPSVNEDEECNSANKARHRRDVGPNTSTQGQRKSHSEVHVPRETELAAETYALLSPTEFLPITPENEDVTAQLLLVSSEDEISRGGDTYA